MILGMAPMQMQHFVLGLAGVHEVPFSSLLKPVGFLWMSSLPYSVSAAPLYVIPKLAKGALYLTISTMIRTLSSMCPHKDLENITPHSPLRKLSNLL